MKIRAILVKILAFFGIKRNRTLIPKISNKELFAVVDVDPLEKEESNGNISVFELTVITQLVKNNQPKYIFEIGTFNGRTTMNLDHFSPGDAVVYTLDLPKEKLDATKFTIEEGDRKYVEKETIGERYLKQSKKIIQLYGDSGTFDFSPYYGKMDFVFVDGAHSAPYVECDTETAFKLIKKGGVILWHDYGVWRDVVKVLNSYYKNDVRFKNCRHITGTSLVILQNK
jgi:predicted O-methyltransferase YrrM